MFHDWTLELLHDAETGHSPVSRPRLRLERVEKRKHQTSAKRRVDWINVLMVQFTLAAWAATLICLFQIGHALAPGTASVSPAMRLAALVPERAQRGTPPPGCVLPPTK